MGFENVRFWGDAKPDNLDRIVEEAMAQRSPKKSVRRNFLAISGGGSDGAFGAGLLVGWSANGSRPQFDLVTGVSTGALIAPFAFLGPDYDRRLKDIYTQHSTSDLLRPMVLAGLLGGAAVSDAQPFEELIERYVTPVLLHAIAREHAKGRRLLIGTTNIDAQRPVIWDMGAIAASGNAGALQLFRRVLQASASIPGVFPPVRINVRVGDQVFDELHVDGGITAQVFFLPSQIMLGAIDRKYGLNGARNLYVIRNGHIRPEYQANDGKLASIAGRSISTMIKSQANGDLKLLYSSAVRDGIAYRLAHIPADFDVVSTEVFDRAYMNALFDLGKTSGRVGYNWRRRPPGQ